MTADDFPPDDDNEALAAELAFGLLDDADAHAAERRAASDPAFRDAVARWRERAASLLTGVGDTPRPSLWAEISARLPANDDAPLASPPRRLPWLIATGLASAAALVLGVIALRPVLPPPTAVVAARAAPPLIAVLRGAHGKAALAVSIDRSAGRLVTAPAGLSLSDHDVELWVIPPGGKPRALGVIDPAVAQRRPAPAQALAVVHPGATLAVSIEPRGGSPTGQPTGAVILTGVVVAA